MRLKGKKTRVESISISTRSSNCRPELTKTGHFTIKSSSDVGLRKDDGRENRPRFFRRTTRYEKIFIALILVSLATSITAIGLWFAVHYGQKSTGTIVEGEYRGRQQSGNYSSPIRQYRGGNFQNESKLIIFHNFYFASNCRF